MARNLQTERWRVRAHRGLVITHDSTFDTEDQARAYYEALAVPGLIRLERRRHGEQRFRIIEEKGEAASEPSPGEPRERPPRATPRLEHGMVEAIANATAAAEDAAARVEDTGTCNLDAPFWNSPRRSKRIENAIQATGLGCSWIGKSVWRGSGYMVSLYLPFQAAKRTAATQAFARSLSRAGYPVGVTYRMD